MWDNNFFQMKSRSAVDLRSTETDFEKLDSIQSNTFGCLAGCTYCLDK